MSEQALALRSEFEASDAKADAAVQTANSAATDAATALSTATTAAEDAAAAREGAANSAVAYDTKANLDADLAYDEGTPVLVTSDPTPANNGWYRKIGESGAGSWEQSSYDRVALVEADVTTLEGEVGAIETSVAGITGGTTVSDQQLRDWAEAGSYEATSVTRDSDGVVSTATVQWPDGSAGTLTVTTRNDDWLAVDAYTITHDDSGKTVTQPAVTRDANTGAVTTKPTLTVS